jgi:membrane protease subunit (stomatin/prohibitin family)
MRRRGPGLLGTMARTAVIAGTATAVSGKVAGNQQAQAQAAATQQQQAAQQAAAQQAAAQQQAMPAAPAADDLTTQIEKLATLKTAGVISEAEFTAAKARLLGI